MSSSDKTSTRASASRATTTTSKTNRGSRTTMSSSSSQQHKQSSSISSKPATGKVTNKGAKTDKVRVDIKDPHSKRSRNVVVSSAAKSSSIKRSTNETKESDSKEMATTNCIVDKCHQIPSREEDNLLEQETNIDASVNQCTVPDDRSKGESARLLSVESSDEKSDQIIVISSASHSRASKVVSTRANPFSATADFEESSMLKMGQFTIEDLPRRESLLLFHDDEEINQITQKTSSDDDEFLDSGPALTVDESSAELSFVVFPLGCCEFDETQLITANDKKAIQKCILRLSNMPASGEMSCWGLNQSQPVLMRLLDDHIQFTDLTNQLLLRSQPIKTIRSWAVDDDNNFAFVVEDRPPNSSASPDSADHYQESFDYALLSQPTFVCYVFRSMDDDDMSCRVAGKLSEGLNRYREEMSDRLVKSTRLQQMVDQPRDVINNVCVGEEDEDELEATSEITFIVKYIGKVQVTRPSGIDVLNVAIDKCLAEASKSQQVNESQSEDRLESPLIEAKLHVSPSSVIVENELTGEIIVECRIRYLTFMGISRRDIRWCGFIMQNTTNKNFIAYTFECHPTAGNVCEAIQHSCSKMYEKIVKNARKPDNVSIVPASSKLRDTLAKTLSRIKLGATILH